VSGATKFMNEVSFTTYYEQYYWLYYGSCTVQLYTVNCSVMRIHIYEYIA